ncbi:MAG: hypothetical protein GVY19_08260 [Bacteroidetes bacterium]|jgi:gamma-glutamylcyclotransferase (GGCT)/AIG2-like uncharacterized protein YtfP|nr:hypothetical protein [Bacteroidota bacterium]
MQCDYLFIYGTLLRELRGRLFKYFEKEMRYISIGYYQGQMYHLGHYPGVVPSADFSDLVKGEVYEITNQQYLEDVLDDYEGAGKNFKGCEEYLRRIEKVKLETGKTMLCWIYIFNRPVHPYKRVTGGDYIKFVRDNHINSLTG